MSQELIKRILSSLILIPITIFFIIKGSFLFLFFISISLIVIIYEWHMMSKKNLIMSLGIFFYCFHFIVFLK